MDIFDINKYGPCPHCLQWVLKSLILRHQNTCMAKRETKFTTSVLVTSSEVLTGRLPGVASKQLREEVFSKMHQDDVGRIARHDKTIIVVGNAWLLRNQGNELKRGQYTSQVITGMMQKVSVANQTSGN